MSVFPLEVIEIVHRKASLFRKTGSVSHEPKRNHPGFSQNDADGEDVTLRILFTGLFFFVIFFYVALCDSESAEIPVCNASASSHELRTLMEGKRGVQTFLSSDCPRCCTVSCRTKKNVSLLSLGSLEILRVLSDFYDKLQRDD